MNSAPPRLIGSEPCCMGKEAIDLQEADNAPNIDDMFFEDVEEQ